MNRKLWLDRRGVPVITTTPKGESNAVYWGWTPATARPLPTREQIAMAIAVDWPSVTIDVADAVLALLKGQTDER